VVAVGLADLFDADPGPWLFGHPLRGPADGFGFAVDGTFDGALWGAVIDDVEEKSGWFGRGPRLCAPFRGAQMAVCSMGTADVKGFLGAGWVLEQTREAPAQLT
jgi:hypothetical protein